MENIRFTSNVRFLKLIELKCDECCDYCGCEKGEHELKAYKDFSNRAVVGDIWLCKMCGDKQDSRIVDEKKGKQWLNGSR